MSPEISGLGIVSGDRFRGCEWRSLKRGRGVRREAATIEVILSYSPSAKAGEFVLTD
jgi:hypothetical protein